MTNVSEAPHLSAPLPKPHNLQSRHYAILVIVDWQILQNSGAWSLEPLLSPGASGRNPAATDSHAGSLTRLWLGAAHQRMTEAGELSLSAGGRGRPMASPGLLSTGLLRAEEQIEAMVEISFHTLS